MFLNLIAIILIIIPNNILHTNADGMIEVFKWKQMDYYNRGNTLISTNLSSQPSGKTHTYSYKNWLFLKIKLNSNFPFDWFHFILMCTYYVFTYTTNGGIVFSLFNNASLIDIFKIKQ